MKLIIECSNLKENNLFARNIEYKLSCHRTFTCLTFIDLQLDTHFLKD